MTKQKHTPTPWRIAPASARFVADAEGIIVAQASVHAQTAHDYAADNASRIVKCVNAHDELVSAARSVHRSAVPLDDDGTTFSISRNAMSKITAILVKLDQVKSRGLPGSKHDGGAS